MSISYPVHDNGPDPQSMSPTERYAYHLSEAQKCMVFADNEPVGDPAHTSYQRDAQIHATLALAAASIHHCGPTDGCL